jgi:hypothetical protein
MNQMYHYATVSKALDELNENGSPMILTCMNRILQNPQKYEIKHIYRYEGNTDPEMKQSFMVSNPNQEKGVVAGFAANSISDAAQVLINISIKNRIKKNRISNAAILVVVFITLKRTDKILWKKISLCYSIKGFRRIKRKRIYL